MKKHVRFGSKSGARTARTLEPARKTMRRQKARCSQSCFFGSKNMARKTSTGAARKKWSKVTIHSKTLRAESQARFICTRPEQMEEYRATCTSAKRFRRRSSHRRELGC